MRESAPSRTDREPSLESEEFCWDDVGRTQTHAMVLGPIVSTLTAEGVVRVLDVGSGNGVATTELADRGFEVLGIDSSLSGLELATRLKSNAQFRLHDIGEPLPADLRGGFDAVVSIEVIEHLFKPRELLHRAREALRPGGVLILTTPYHGYLKNVAIAVLNKFDQHVHPLRDFGHIKFFSAATLKQVTIEAGFAVESVKRVGRIPQLAKSMILTARRGG